MQGKSHFVIGLAVGIAVDSIWHLSGPALIGAHEVTGSMIANKAVYYAAVGIGALLPDIDNARSIMGQRFGGISKMIQKLVGHRTFFHSILGLLVAALLALGLEQLIAYILQTKGLVAPANLMRSWHIFLIGILAGSIIHILCDSLTRGGVPLFWPNKYRFGIPPNPNLRFKTGTWPEFLITGIIIVLVAVGLFTQKLIF